MVKNILQNEYTGIKQQKEKGLMKSGETINYIEKSKSYYNSTNLRQRFTSAYYSVPEIDCYDMYLLKMREFDQFKYKSVLSFVYRSIIRGEFSYDMDYKDRLNNTDLRYNY